LEDGIRPIATRTNRTFSAYFGGFKLSGIGSKVGGPDYLLQFVIPRVITENTMRRGFAPDAKAGE